MNRHKIDIALSYEYIYDLSYKKHVKRMLDEKLLEFIKKHKLINSNVAIKISEETIDELDIPKALVIDTIPIQESKLQVYPVIEGFDDWAYRKHRKLNFKERIKVLFTGKF